MRHLGGRCVVEGVSLELQRGEVLGLLGHNGAGKSTTMQMLTGCLLPDAGEITVCGHNLRSHPELARRSIGYLPENPPLYRDDRVETYLAFAAGLRQVPAPRIAEAVSAVLAQCGLEAVRRQRIGTLSKGYQQRVGIAQALVHNPEVIVLDEPTVGLDPAQIRDVRSLIHSLAQHRSVLLSTHLLAEVEAVCDRVLILQQGRPIFAGSMADLHGHADEGETLEDAFLRITEAA